MKHTRGRDLVNDRWDSIGDRPSAGCKQPRASSGGGSEEGG